MSRAGYTGHHINSIVFLPNSNHPGGVDDNLHSNQGRRGRWTNLGRGKLIGRRAMLQ